MNFVLDETYTVLFLNAICFKVHGVTASTKFGAYGRVSPSGRNGSKLMLIEILLL